MTAQEFWKQFSTILLKSKDDAIKVWASSKEYTIFILGKIADFLKKQKFETSKEYYRIDLTGWTQLKGDKYKLFADKAFENYLWDLEVAIEHENNDKSWMDEVVKLLHINCPLRVVIGYLPLKENDKQQQYLDEITTQIITTKAVNDLASLENGDFMIIIGDSKCDSDKNKYCNYQAYVFNKNHKKFERLP